MNVSNLFKVSIKNTAVIIVNFKQISHIALVFLLFTLKKVKEKVIFKAQNVFIGYSQEGTDVLSL